MGHAGARHFHQPAGAGERVRELGQGVHSLRATLVEHSYGHQGHTGPRVVEGEVEAAACEVA